MIVFLTLCYCAILAVLVKLKVVRLTTFWKLSPVIWFLVLFVVLYIPLQWGAPSGAVNIYRPVVEILPNVSGEVTEVIAQPLKRMKKGDVLFKLDPVPYKAKVDELRAKVELTEVRLKQYTFLAKRAAGRKFDVQQYTAELEAYKAQLRRAQYDLDQTVVRAPSAGYVVGLTLRPGQRVTNLPLRSWMAYVNEERSIVALGISQNRLRHVRVGQEAEVVLNLYPGRTFKAKVVRVAYITPEGQLQASGMVPRAPTAQQPRSPMGVILKLDKEPKMLGLPGGSVGTAAVYTKSVKVAHVIRRVMMRMDTWLNYLRPF